MDQKNYILKYKLGCIDYFLIDKLIDLFTKPSLAFLFIILATKYTSDNMTYKSIFLSILVELTYN